MTRTLLIVGLIVFVLILIGYVAWPSIIHWMLPADSRPATIVFPVDTISDEEFAEIAQTLSSSFPEQFDHVDRFRKAGIRAYEGPKTCLRCHEYAQIENAETGEVETVDLMENLLESSHYRFFTTRHPNVWGFNGELADDFPMGKIDRPCPKPGSFAFTAWAEVVELADGTLLSEGCGQCHIGGQVQAPLGELMPGYRTTQAEKEAIDCLICHAAAYDMNKKQVVVGADGRGRWDQDRSMVAAMSIVTPTAKTCLRCHQHNFGGDIYIDELDSLFMQSQWNLGHTKPRIAHPGSKRGTPYSPSWDVHAAQNMACIECHTTQGHLIAKGTHTTTMMANDLPDVEVSCEKCHSAEPHSADPELAEFYNMHTLRIACVTCHIPTLHADNATMRDFDSPWFEEHPLDSEQFAIRPDGHFECCAASSAKSAPPSISCLSFMHSSALSTRICLADACAIDPLLCLCSRVLYSLFGSIQDIKILAGLSSHIGSSFLSFRQNAQNCTESIREQP